MKQLIVTGKNTGATYQFFYSIDNGNSFLPLLNEDGASSFTTSDDGTLFVRRFKASHILGSNTTGRTLLWRILNNDGEQVEIHRVKLVALIRKGETIGNV